MNAKFRSECSNRESGPTFLDFPLSSSLSTIIIIIMMMIMIMMLMVMFMMIASVDLGDGGSIVVVLLR